MEEGQQDICRVCRSEGSPDKPLFHPCVCTGSIKYIHQDCLVQWLKYSKKEYCELCNHRFSFTPIYSPDMPKRLPLRDIVSGLITSIGTAIRYWLHYTLVAFAWLGVVPLTACRIYRCLFTGSINSILTVLLDILSTENLVSDCFQGCFVVTCTLCAFISLVWLREQIFHGGGPEWLEQEPAQVLPPQGNNGGQIVDQPQQPQHIPAANQNAENNGPLAVIGGAPQEAEDIGEIAGNVNNAAQDDINWNPIEWDRAADELTWERLLGLDGSLVFMEHVFWVVSLNTLFIFIFAFCPYHIGHFLVFTFTIEEFINATHFEGLLTTLIGYVAIALTLVVLHSLATLAKLRRSKRLLGLCYVVVKVSLLVVGEIGVFPLMCGWWLDICSLSMFDASLLDRETSFKLAPGTSMFIHWLVGTVYVFYFASFILLLREVLRPGVLWFLRNLNDPDFHPIHEMIHLQMSRHARRFLLSMIIFGSTVLLMLWLPAGIIKRFWPGFFPYNVLLSSDAPVSELSLELLLLQVVLPALLEQGHTRMWLKSLVRGWTIGAAYLLDLRSYLLGDVPLTDEDDKVEGDLPANNRVPQLPPLPPPQEENILQVGGLGVAHQALLQGGGPTGFQPYKRPRFFAFRLLCLLMLMCATLLIASLVCLTLPVFIGRNIMSMWMGNIKIHELYTAACGLYVCWLTMRAITLMINWIPQGWNAIVSKLKQWAILVGKSAVLAMVIIGMIPLLLGMLFELVVVAPLRVPLDQSPIFFPWQDWALGVLHVKIICAITMMGPNWWLKRVMEQVYQNGLRNMNLKFILQHLAIPVLTGLGLCLSIPYVLACSIIPLFGVNFETQNLVLRRIYPSLLVVILLLAFCVFQARQFHRLYEHIKNDKYLVGQRLVNYERKANSSNTQQTSQSMPQPPAVGLVHQ